MLARTVRPRRPIAWAALLVGAACTDAPSAPSLAPRDAPSANATADYAQTSGFRRAVTLAGVREHQAAFQAHADLNGGVRATSLPGFEASASYVAARANAAGYVVSDYWFSFLYVADRTPPRLERVSPGAQSYVNGVDFASLSYSGSAEVTAPVVAVQVRLVPGTNPQSSGCQAADFAGFPAGAIALLERGGCNFVDMAQNAQAAGASGVVIFNDGADALRMGVFNGTLGQNPGVSIPVVGTSFAVGVALANGVSNGSTGTTAHLRVDFLVQPRTGRNVIAESRGGNADRVIVVAARLDGDTRGPAINATSGAAVALEIAEQFAAQERTPDNRLRFVWFGGTSQGLLGSQAYVAALGTAERARIAAVIGLEVLGSPNFGRFVYDAPAAPAGSAAITTLLTEYFQQAGLLSARYPVPPGADHAPFATAGIPFGGLYAGTSELKTAEHEALFGGTAGFAFDLCRHLACDTFANVNETGLDQMADAAAHAVLLLSRRNLTRSPLATP